MKYKSLLALPFAIFVFSSNASSAMAAPNQIRPIIKETPNIQTRTTTKYMFNDGYADQWQGAYLGLDFGYISAKASVVQNDPVLSDPNFSILSSSNSGPIAGIFGGTNFALPHNVVVGLEGSLTSGISTGIDQELSLNKVTGEGANAVTTSEHRLELRNYWIGALRARLGYAMGSFLPYVAGGGSFYNYERIAIVNNDSTYMRIDNGSASGMSLGLGCDYALRDSIMLRAEYRFTDYFNFQSYDANNELKDASYTPHEVRVGVAYRF